MLTRWSIPEPTPARVTAPEYDKAYRRAMGYDLPARPAHLCILGPDYATRSRMSKALAEESPEEHDAMLAKKAADLAEREAIREAKREEGRKATRERVAAERAMREAVSKANKKTGKPFKHVKFANLPSMF